MKTKATKARILFWLILILVITLPFKSLGQTPLWQCEQNVEASPAEGINIAPALAFRGDDLYVARLTRESSNPITYSMGIRKISSDGQVLDVRIRPQEVNTLFYTFGKVSMVYNAKYDRITRVLPIHAAFGCCKSLI